MTHNSPATSSTTSHGRGLRLPSPIDRESLRAGYLQSQGTDLVRKHEAQTQPVDQTKLARHTTLYRKVCTELQSQNLCQTAKASDAQGAAQCVTTQSTRREAKGPPPDARDPTTTTPSFTTSAQEHPSASMSRMAVAAQREWLRTLCALGVGCMKFDVRDQRGCPPSHLSLLPSLAPRASAAARASHTEAGEQRGGRAAIPATYRASNIISAPNQAPAPGTSDPPTHSLTGSDLLRQSASARQMSDFC